MRVWVWLVVVLLGVGGAGMAQGGAPLTNIGVDVLSDRGEVDLNPYFEHLVGALNRTWQPLVAKMDAGAPAHSETVIAVTIEPDGRVGAMRLESSTKDEGLNKAAWGAVAGTKFAALPAGMRRPVLKLRLHFQVN